jgi:hypothetical protein
VVLVVGPRMVLVLGLNLHGFRALGDEVPVLLRAFFRFVYMRSNRLLNNVRSSSRSMSNSLSRMDTRQDKENCLEDMLALVLEPNTRARL